MPSYRAQDFIDVIPGTGGIITVLAERVGCAWHTAKRYIEDHPTVMTAWEAETHKVTDRAVHNIVKSIYDGDLAMSKWWAQMRHPDFTPKSQHELSGPGGGPIIIVDWDDDIQAEDEAA